MLAIHRSRSAASRLLLLPLLVLAVVLVGLFGLASPAFAQGAPVVAPVPPTLSAPVAVVMALSLVLGFVTQMVQTGNLLGLVVTPKGWLPGLTVFATFLGGVVAYFSGLGAAFQVNATTVVYGLSAGLASLLAGSAAGIANHAHIVTPAAVMATRRAAAVAALKLAGGVLVVATLFGCQGCVNGQLPPQVVPSVDLAVCIFNNYATTPSCRPTGGNFVQCVGTLANACGSDAVSVANVLTAQKKAMVADGFVPAPATDGGK